MFHPILDKFFSFKKFFTDILITVVLSFFFIILLNSTEIKLSELDIVLYMLFIFTCTRLVRFSNV